MYRKLPPALRTKIRSALFDLATRVGGPERGGKSVKTIQGVSDTFHRLRVGDHRVMYDVLPEDRVLLILGIVHRSELERWLRTR